MYSDSDDEYDDSGFWLHRYQARESARPALRLYHPIEYRIKNAIHRKVLEERAKLYVTMGSGYQAPPERELLRARLDDPDMPAWDDWRRWRVIRFFREIQAFHKGSLDLCGRPRARYEALMQKLSLLCQDLNPLIPLVERVDVEREEIDHDTVQLVKKTISVPFVRDAAAWDEFRRKWALPRTIDYEDLSNLLVESHQVLAAHPLPKFQTLWIVDIPPEVLTMVFGYCTVEEARALSATCHYLRDVGLTYIYTTRRIFMASPIDLDKHVAGVEPEIIAKQVRALLAASLGKCMREMDFLSSRPDICGRIRRVFVGDTWSSELFHGTELGKALQEALRSQVYAPVFLQRFAQLLPQLAVEFLQLHRLEISLELGQRIARQPGLVSLDVRYCEAPAELWQHMLSSAAGSPQSSIESLTIQLHPAESASQVFSAWNVLALCPNIRLLRVSTIEIKNGFDVPDRRLWPHMACIARVEYLHLNGLHWNQVIDLVDWLSQSAARSGGLCITHLKLHSAWGIPDAMIGQLLQSLHTGHAPLRVLVLDGIMGTDAAIFDTLGQLFPSLEGLTLVRRANDRQCISNLCQWPLPVYEYAQHMQGLTRLRHFGANFYWEPDNISPAVLRRLEPVYSADEDRERFGWDYMDDGYSVALPFAAHCPALETFAITAEWMTYAARIYRSPSGAVELKNIDSRLSDPEFDVWNPSTYSTRAWQLPLRKENA